VGLGYARTPAIESAEQVAAWKKITAAVHAKGGRIFMQFMHVGRIGHSANRYTSEPLITPSGVRANGQIWTDAQGLQDYDQPRAIETAEIPGVIEGFAQATRNALEAMIAAAGDASKIGIKISPAMPFNDIQDDDPVETYTTLVKAIAPMGLAYLHVLRTPPIPNIFEILRPLYPGTFAAGGAFDLASGNARRER